MLITSARYRLGLLIILAWGLGACATPQLSVQPIPPTANPSEEIKHFDAALNTARQQELNVLAPMWFAEAEESLHEARQALASGADTADVLQKVAYGRAQLQRAEEMAQVVRTALPEVIQARHDARAVNASSLGRDYEDAEEQFLALTRAAESDKVEWAQSRQSKVSATFRDLELRAIKTQTIGEVRQLMAQAEQQQMQRIAPTTFAQAQRTLADTDAFISENRYAKDTMRKKAQEALFQAQRLRYVAEQSTRLQRQQPENVILWVEEMLASITRMLRAPDVRNRPLETQVENIINSIAALRNERRLLDEQLQTRKAEIMTLQRQLVDLGGQTRQDGAPKEPLAQPSRVVQGRGEAERRLQRLFAEVARQFDANEAEVYTQGDRLVIRLQDMQFDAEKHVITPADYALLGKVQQAVRRFDAPAVIIEGYTNSMSTDATNQYVSQRWAEAVREYLIANGALPGEKITAVGYGAARPLASNATAEGRAKNRHIDVIIAPQSATTP